MIGLKSLPENYQAWNERWGAPYGRPESRELSIRQRFASDDPASLGPFAFQVCNHTRVFEYPWAYFVAGLEPGMRVLEVGGGLSGLQYALAQEGLDVINIDPEAKVTERTWSGFPTAAVPLNLDNHEQLNKVFGTSVRLVPEKVQESGLPAESFDRAFCLSVIEHVSQDEAKAMIAAVRELLKPGGLLVLTIDLFLDVKPFGVLDTNVWGTNIDVSALVTDSGLEMIAGDPTELHGFPEFDFDKVVERMPEYFMGYFSALSQALVLRKPTSAG
jgi:2-polyprenyl-3-methyl-5-hydroxy-6-metoxy-1,4-benzoquinol methylase